jgi:hypothetical protein
MKHLLTLLTLIALALPTTAGTLTHDSGVSFWVPNDWSQAIDSDDDVQITSPDETATALFFVMPMEDGEEAVDGAFEALEQLFGDISIETEPTETTINGLDAMVLDGNGTTDGVPMDWAMGMFEYGDKMVLVIAFCASDFTPQHAPNMKRILNSVQ